MENATSQRIAEALHYLQAKVPPKLQQPIIGIICGSGLNGLAEAVLPEPRFETLYTDIPHFPPSTVQGHAGKLLFGVFEPDALPVVLMVGRIHFYEGHSIQSITFPVRLMKRLGVDTIIVTNAAGGLNEDYAVGDLMVLNDHINLAGLAGIHPLRGPNADDFGVRFPALSDAYDLDLRRLVHHLWKELDRDAGSTRRLREGTYAFVGGPSYETRAECRILRRLGADVVGMSTVPEIIAARHCNMRVLAISLVTNNALLEAGPRGDDVQIQGSSRQDLTKAIQEGRANHDEVIDAGKKAAREVQVSRTAPNQGIII
ncbi:hypothetical protein IMSHALPRED_004202 [Imshaugia aleurites]|uniref:Purine nucleoside phosphorylase n=1 Tax=Imshaugia aleurites TaxID=172621 RepID=A0A8H3I7Q7_9LECA|nr:hypothetical protein IMSHALPRED_004202 [Imshaugia aleurites]